MLNEQLAAYVREEVAKGVSRGEIAKALLAAGWQFEDVNATLISLGVPMAGLAPAPLPPPPAPPVSAMPAVNKPFVPANPASYVPVSPLGSAASTQPMAATPVSTDKLPGVFALIKNGIDIYRARFGTIISIALIEIGMSIALIGILMIAVVAGAVGVVGFAMTSPSSLPVLIGGGILGGVLFMALFVWVSSWITLALFHAIRGATEGIGIGESFRRARPQVWSLVWVGILNGLTVLGALALFAGLPVAILYFGGLHLLGPTSVLVTILAVTVGIFASIAVFCVFVTWLFFSIWILIDTDARGLSVPVASMRMAHAHFGAVFGRFLALALLTALATIPVSIVLSLLLLSVPSGVRALISGALNQAVTFLIIYPVFFGAMFSLYAAVKARTASVDASAGRWKFTALIVIGLITLCSLPFIAIALIPSVVTAYEAAHSQSIPAQRANDALRKSNIAELQLYLELYDSQESHYPATLAELSAISPSFVMPTDPVTHESYIYEVSGDGMGYKLCATLDSGEEYCKQYPDTTDGTSDAPMPSFQSSTVPSTPSDVITGPTLALTAESTKSITVYYTDMPASSIDIVNADTKKMVWKQQLGKGDGTITMTPPTGTLVAGSVYRIEARDASGVLLAGAGPFMAG